jgi:N-acetylmuramoyl-L-alanine amidase
MRKKKNKFGLFITCLLSVCVTTLQAQKKVNQKIDNEIETVKVVIDPGHGGIDPGTEGSKDELKDEKDITLDIALKVGALVNENYDNVKIIYTRKRDITVSLEQRVGIANDSKGDYFVSIHCNSSKKKHIYGTQMHVQDFTYRKSTKLAQILDEEFTTRAKRNSKGLFNSKDRRFNLYVLQNTTMPGVLIETGFLSHQQEELFLNSENGQDIVAAAIFRGIRNFLSQSGHKLSIKEKEEGKKESEKKETAKKNEKDIKNLQLTSYNEKIPPKMKSPTLTNEKVVYKIQIFASPKKINITQGEFKKLDMKINEIKTEDKKGDITYKYTVGNVYTIEDALELMEYVQKKGFKDAFIAKFGR